MRRQAVRQKRERCPGRTAAVARDPRGPPARMTAVGAMAGERPAAAAMDRAGARPCIAPRLRGNMVPAAVRERIADPHLPAVSSSLVELPMIRNPVRPHQGRTGPSWPGEVGTARKKNRDARVRRRNEPSCPAMIRPNPETRSGQSGTEPGNQDETMWYSTAGAPAHRWHGPGLAGQHGRGPAGDPAHQGGETGRPSAAVEPEGDHGAHPAAAPRGDRRPKRRGSAGGNGITHIDVGCCKVNDGARPDAEAEPAPALVAPVGLGPARCADLHVVRLRIYRI